MDKNNKKIRSVLFEEGKKLILDAVGKVGTEKVPLEEAAFRVLAEDICAAADVPAFDRSPLDGYAFRAEDTAGAGKSSPACLRVVDNIAAGEVSSEKVTPGTAVRLMTGAPVPEGADAVVKYEDTEFTDTEVKIFQPAEHGQNVIYAGEDVKKGTLLADAGKIIDPGLLGTLAGQNVSEPLVYRRLRVGIISTGSELLPVGSTHEQGMVIDTNSYTLTGVVRQYGFEARSYGIIRDNLEEITETIVSALQECDALLLTGGSSVGDYDLTTVAMKDAGVELLFDGANLKPGRACAYGVKDGRLVCGLPGNPSSGVTNMYALGVPGLLKMSGRSEGLKEITVKLKEAFRKTAKATRLVKGVVDFTDGEAEFHILPGQGNVMLSGLIGCNCLAVIPPGEGPFEAGDRVKAILL